MREIVMSLFCETLCYALVTQIGENIAIGRPTKKKQRRNYDDK